MQIEVDARKDANGALIPQRLRFDRREVAVRQVLDRWHGADYQYFKVIGEDENLYILRFDEPDAAWSLTMFDFKAKGEHGRRAPASRPH